MGPIDELNEIVLEGKIQAHLRPLEEKIAELRRDVLTLRDVLASVEKKRQKQKRTFTARIKKLKKQLNKSR